LKSCYLTEWLRDGKDALAEIATIRLEKLED
jgi:hypothetical protein